MAVRYACGNSVISNTLDDARQLAFSNNEKVKVSSYKYEIYIIAL